MVTFNTLGERLRYARKTKGYTQISLAGAIGVTRGVIFNIEKNLAKPQTIVLNAICRTLDINNDWLVHGEGKMESTLDYAQSSKVLIELFEVTKDLSENELRYLLDVIQSFKNRFEGLL